MTVLVPATLDDACAALAARPGATVLAGGTDLMVGINAGRARPIDVVAVGRPPELRAWSRDGDELVPGAGVTYPELLEPSLAAPVPVPAPAAPPGGAPHIRHAGARGG